MRHGIGFGSGSNIGRYDVPGHEPDRSALIMIITAEDLILVTTENARSSFS
ncbi:MAG TPA: hypothetical protein G4N92_05460 [Anaerolineae bacterium]|nr:hypothetical protein [Anaerolineae bacterium]